MIVKPVTFKTGVSTLRVLLASITLMATAGQALADTDPIQINIKSGPAGKALLNLAEQAGVQITLPQQEGISRQLKSINGEYTLAGALDLMLDGSGLVYEFTSDSTVIVKQSDGDNPSAGKKRAIKDKSQIIEEITVTATKRETSLQDTALSISTLSNDVIEKRGLTEMADYLSTVPGVTQQDLGGEDNAIVIRGIATSPQRGDATVSVYFGETPVVGQFFGFADFKMVDIERVEVLRGPQGTLFGAASLGGAVRIIPAAPNLSELSGNISAEYSSTARKGSQNSVFQGVVNVPLIEDKLAIRAALYQYDTSGYLKNIAGSYDGETGVSPPFFYSMENHGLPGQAVDISDIGAEKADGVRISLLWQATERLSISGGYLWQETDQFGVTGEDSELPGDYTQLRAFPVANGVVGIGSTGFDTGFDGVKKEAELFHLTADYDFGWGALHSVSSWLDQQGLYRLDITQFLNFGPFGAAMDRRDETFAQEIRFASEFDGRVQFLVGYYYEKHEAFSNDVQRFTGDPGKEIDSLIALFGGIPPLPADAPPGYMLQNDFYYDTTRSLKQSAVFGEVSVELTDEVTVTGGVRHFNFDQDYIAYQYGLLSGFALPSIASDLEGTNRGETYKANISWEPNDDVLLYFQWSQGFRKNNPLPKLPAALYDADGDGFYDTRDGDKVAINDSLDPDELTNYELGFKLAFADNRFVLNGALYHMDWEGLPVVVNVVQNDNPDLGSGYSINAGKSDSRGFELEGYWQIVDTLHLDAGVSYNTAKLRSDSSLGPAGTVLPGSADVVSHIGLEYGFDFRGYDSFVRTDYSYLSEFEPFLNLGDTSMVGGYGMIDLRAGVSFEKFDVNFYVKNLSNADNLTWVDINRTIRYRQRPRTVGVSIAYHF